MEVDLWTPANIFDNNWFGLLRIVKLFYVNALCTNMKQLVSESKFFAI